MKTTIVILTLLTNGLLALPIHAADAPPTGQRVWCVQFDNGGVVDLYLLAEGEQVISAFAIETRSDAPWLVDSQNLTVVRGECLQGSLILKQGPVQARLVPERNVAGQEPERPVAELALDLTIKDGRITGTITTPKPTNTSLLGFRVASVPVRGSVQPNYPNAEARIELMAMRLFGHTSGFFVRSHLRAGKVYESKLIPISNVERRELKELPDCPGLELFDGYKLKGSMPLKYKQIDGVLSFDSVVILGDFAAGLATWETGGQKYPTCIRARISRAAYARPFEVGVRTWPAQGKPLERDAAMAVKAMEEYQVPIRTYAPGKPHYSTRLLHKPDGDGATKYYALYPPSIAFGEVPRAEKYRIKVEPYRNPANGPSWSFETDKPWAALTPVWKDVPQGYLTITATALDAAGKEIGKAALPATEYAYKGDLTKEPQWRMPDPAKVPTWKFPAMPAISVMHRAPFEGPYWAPNKTVKESALAGARHILYDDEWYYNRNLVAWAIDVYAPLCGSFARACMVIAQLTDDPNERREALAMGDRSAWTLFLTHRGEVPNVYGGNMPLNLWVGFGYLDVYKMTRDERFKEAAMDLAKVLCSIQQQDGGWGSGGTPKSPYPAGWGGGTFGPSEWRTNAGDAVLYFLGRVRKELGTDAFVQNEARANRWVQTMCLPGMEWQNVGFHSMEMIPLQDMVAPHALSYCTWVLDYAQDKDRDLKVVAEIARWAEERHVDWSRTSNQSTASLPSCWGWGRAAGTGIRVAGGLAYVFARLGQETGDPLWTAKAQALVQSIQAAQDPVMGGIPYQFQRTTLDTATGVMSHHYDTTEAIRNLLEVARITH